MKGFTSSLWPIRYKPLPDELLSCWLVRLAHGHGLKVQTFCNLLFGSRYQVWNRDIDRLAPEWLLRELSNRTGTSYEEAWQTTLRAYEGILYRKFRLSSTLQWILALKLYHRKRDGYGLQFCPACLSEDATPYFRKKWRIALNTVCTLHKTMLLDRCPGCCTAVAVHRIDVAKQEAFEIGPMSCCHMCCFDLRNAPQVYPSVYDEQAFLLLLEANRVFDEERFRNGKWDIGHYSVLHQLCRIMTGASKHTRLREYVANQLEVQDIALGAQRSSFEILPIEERHHIVQLAAWLLVDVEKRITAAWQAKAVRYNVLLKDFDDPPAWFCKLTRELSA